jgi:hypothetical protein
MTFKNPYQTFFAAIALALTGGLAHAQAAPQANTPVPQPVSLGRDVQVTLPEVPKVTPVNLGQVHTGTSIQVQGASYANSAGFTIPARGPIIYDKTTAVPAKSPSP